MIQRYYQVLRKVGNYEIQLKIDRCCHLIHSRAPRQLKYQAEPQRYRIGWETSANTSMYLGYSFYCFLSFICSVAVSIFRDLRPRIISPMLILFATTVNKNCISILGLLNKRLIFLILEIGHMSVLRKFKPDFCNVSHI